MGKKTVTKLTTAAVTGAMLASTVAAPVSAMAAPVAKDGNETNAETKSEAKNLDEAKTNLDEAKAANEKAVQAENDAKSVLNEAKKAQEEKEPALQEATKKLNDTKSAKDAADKGVADAEKEVEIADTEAEVFRVDNSVTEAKLIVMNNALKLEDLQDELDTANADKKEKDAVVTEKEKAVKTAESDLKSAQTAYDNADSKTKDAISKKEDAEKVVSQAESDLESVKAEKEQAEQNVEAAKETVSSAQTKVEEAQKTYDEASDNLNTAKSQGSVGFFSSIGDTAAVDLFSSSDYTNGLKYTNVGAEGDATSLENMKKALEYIAECNDILVNVQKTSIFDDGSGSNKLLPLDVTSFMMATAQINANYSNSADNYVKEDTYSESLAHGVSDPYDSWYYNEIKLWNQRVEEAGGNPSMVTDTTGLEDLYNMCTNIGGYTGFGVCTKNGTNSTTYCQRFSMNVPGPYYSIEDYTALFNEYYEKVTVTMPKEVENAKTALDSAKSELTNAQNDLSNKNKLVEEAQKKISAKQQEKENAEQQLANAKEELSKIQGGTEVEENLTKAKANLANAEEELKTAQDAADAAGQVVSEKEEEIEKIHKEDEEVEKLIEERSAELEKVRKKYKDLTGKDADTDGKKAREHQEAANKALEEKKAEQETATKAYDTAKSEYDQIQKEIDDLGIPAKEQAVKEATAEREKSETELTYAQTVYDQMLSEAQGSLKATFDWDSAKDSNGKITGDTVKITNISSKTDDSFADTTATIVKTKDRAATCTEDGVIVYKATATITTKAGVQVGTVTDTYTETTNAFGHDYGEPVWSDWKEENGKWICSATFTCKHDNSHVIAPEVKVSAESKDATCTTAGTVTYTASVEVNGKTYTKPDTKTTQGVLGHGLKADWSWKKTKNGYEASVTATCSKGDFEGTGKAAATLDKSQSVAPTYSAEGKNVYVAEVTVKDADGKEGGTVTGTYTETVAKLSNPFRDVHDGDWYKDSVMWALDQKVTTGKTANTFGSNDTCTRAEAVTFLWRAAGSPDVSGETGFSDVKSDAYYAKAVIWAAQNGITTGMGDGTFRPNQSCSRAEIVTFLWRMEGKQEVPVTGTTFKDINENEFYYNAVLWAVNNDITTGQTEEKFAPGKTCTRSEIVTFLYREFK